MNAHSTVAPVRLRPDWPRLMGEADAAAYLSIGTSLLREKGPAPKRSNDKLGKRVVWDRRDLDRWADALSDQPLEESDAEAHAREVERQFLEQRGKRA